MANINDLLQAWAGGGNVSDALKAKYGGAGSLNERQRAYHGIAVGTSLNDGLYGVFGPAAGPNFDDRAQAYYSAPTLSGASFVDLNNALTNNLGPDGMTWAQAWPICVDEFGKLIVACQSNGNGIQYMYSNDEGATWTPNAGITGNGSVGSVESFITRSSLAWDATNHCLWALHVTTTGGDGGAFVRRYTVTRDGSNNLTGIVRDQSASCVLEDALNTSCRQPILFWKAGKLVAIWDIADASVAEVHGTTRALSGVPASDLAAANWRRLDGGAVSDTCSVTATRNAPITLMTPAYAAHITPAACLVRNGPNAGSLVLFWQDALSTGMLRYRRFPASGANWSAPTVALLISSTIRAGTGTIRQLYEVLAKPVEDASGNVYVAFASWKDNTAGDTWAVAKVTTGDALSGVVDVYSCGGAFAPALYALAGDIAYDAGRNCLVVTWVTTGGVGLNDGRAQVVSTALQLQGAAYTFFTVNDVDIPLIYQRADTGATRVQGGSKLLILFRDTRNQAPPYHGWAGTVVIS